MKEKKKYRDDEVFSRTKSGRYVALGYQWRGFPTDGIWLVQNGKSNMACLISLKEQVPIMAMNYRVHAQPLCEAIQKSHKDHPGGLSLYDEAKLACDYFAGVAAAQIEKGGR